MGRTGAVTEGSAESTEGPWRGSIGPGPIIATAIHAGHDVRESLVSVMSIEEDIRLREEDPFTDKLAERFPTHISVDTSRFVVDLNRPPESAVYQRPDDAWGLEVWSRTLTVDEIRDSKALHARFYHEFGELVQRVIAEYGFVVVYDIHSYNHRRGGPRSAPSPPAENPTVNIGTGTLPTRWRPVADALLKSLDGEGIDARENVKFQGGYLSQWVHERYGGSGCATAIECKKVFMDEWTGVVDEDIVKRLANTLEQTAAAVTEAASTA
jgi:N-formylglutamate amidohydrolase